MREGGAVDKMGHALAGREPNCSIRGALNIMDVIIRQAVLSSEMNPLVSLVAGNSFVGRSQPNDPACRHMDCFEIIARKSVTLGKETGIRIIGRGLVASHTLIFHREPDGPVFSDGRCIASILSADAA